MRLKEESAGRGAGAALQIPKLRRGTLRGASGRCRGMRGCRDADRLSNVSPRSPGRRPFSQSLRRDLSHITDNAQGTEHDLMVTP